MTDSTNQKLSAYRYVCSPVMVESLFALQRPALVVLESKPLLATFVAERELSAAGWRSHRAAREREAQQLTVYYRPYAMSFS